MLPETEIKEIKNATALEMYRAIQSKPENEWKEIISSFTDMVYNNLSDQMKELDDQRESLLTTIQSIKQ